MIANIDTTLFKDIDEPGLNTLSVYSKRGGYEMLKKALKMEPGAVLDEMLASGVRGRGGAGFAMGRKMSFIPKGTMDKYLVCNADESEPGTFKDRELMQKNPHLLIEGIIIGAYCIGATRSFIFIRGEYDYVADILDAALAEVAGLARFLDRPLEDLRLLLVLAADVDEGAVRVGGVGGDDHPLHEHVGGLLHQLAVLERAGLGLVGVADEVLVHRPLGDEGHLLAHREARAAAAAHARVKHLLQHVGRLHLQRLAQHLVAALLGVAVERRQPGLVDVRVEKLVAHDFQ